MPTTFITGATGFIGGHLVRRLCQRGHHVRALVRPESCYDKLKSMPVELVMGDLSQVDVIEAATRDCEWVFHTAADYRLWTRSPAKMYASNVEGTRNILNAAWKFGVKRVVYTSTVGTIGLDGRIPADETSFMQCHARTGHYKRSKFLAEVEALAFAKRGLPVVTVNPSTPVGSHDWKPTPTGRIIVDFLNGRMPMYLDTGLNLVDVEDVADGHILAAEKGRVGERYILGHENLKLKEILDLLADITGLPSPKLRCPYAMALLAAWGSETLTWLTGGNDPRVPREGVYMARQYMFFDSKKARSELGYTTDTVRQALTKAVVWFLENGYVTRRLPSSFRLPEQTMAPRLSETELPVHEGAAVVVGK